MGEIDWYDLAPALAFAVLAALAARFIGGSAVGRVGLAFAYMGIAAVVAAASVGFGGLDGVLGAAAASIVFAVLITPLWLYSRASGRTPATEAEIAAAVEEAEALLAIDPTELDHDYDLLDRADVARAHLDNLLWRTAEDAPRRSEIANVLRRLEQWAKGVSQPSGR